MHHLLSLIDTEYFKDDQRMPFYLLKHCDMQEIFNACAGGVSNQMIFEKRPLWVKENTASVLDQNTCGIWHPFDLQAENNTPSNVVAR